MLGKLVESISTDYISINQLEIGSQYQSGLYNVIIQQGENIKSVKVIKN